MLQRRKKQLLRSGFSFTNIYDSQDSNGRGEAISLVQGPNKSWQLQEFEKCPGKSWDLLILIKNPGKVLEFYTIFVR